MGNEKNVVTLDCNVSKEVFTNKATGENIEYYSLKVLIDGQAIKVVVRTESKELFNYLIKDYFE